MASLYTNAALAGGGIALTVYSKLTKDAEAPLPTDHSQATAQPPQLRQKQGMYFATFFFIILSCTRVRHAIPAVALIPPGMTSPFFHSKLLFEIGVASRPYGMSL